MYCWIKLICNLCHFSVSRTVRNSNVSANRNFSYWHRHWKTIINVCKRDWMVGIGHLVVHKRLGIHCVRMQTGRVKWKCPIVIRKIKIKKKKTKNRGNPKPFRTSACVVRCTFNENHSLHTNHSSYDIFLAHNLHTMFAYTYNFVYVIFIQKERERFLHCESAEPNQTKPNPHTIMPKSTSPSGLENIVH